VAPFLSCAFSPLFLSVSFFFSLSFSHSTNQPTGSGAAACSSWPLASCPESRTGGASGRESSARRKVRVFFFFVRLVSFSLCLSLPLTLSFSISSKTLSPSPTRRRRLQPRLLPRRPRRRQPPAALLRRQETGRLDALLRGVVPSAAVSVHRAERQKRERGRR